MNDGRTGLHAPRGYTLIELMVTLVIISILASLSLGGLAVARQRVKRDRTEMTIRKIHEVVMPHFERFLNRNVPSPDYDSSAAPPALQAAAGIRGRQAVQLIAKRRMMALELPDGWKDLVPASPANTTQPIWTTNAYESGVSRRLRGMLPATAPQVATIADKYSDAECLWLSVMRGGYADQAIIGHFRNDEFGDKDADGQREFIDGWGNPIRFLRWAPAFVSKYQPMPDATSTETRSHDAIDPAGIDPLARNTLFPLIFSTGPDGLADIACRDNESGGAFTYPGVAYDPYFVPSGSLPDYYANPAVRPVSPGRFHMRFTIGGYSDGLGRYEVANASQYAGQSPDPVSGGARMFGSFVRRVVKSDAGAPLAVISDDVHNHAMSR